MLNFCVMKTCRSVEVCVHAFLTFALVEDKAALHPAEDPWVSFEYEDGWALGAVWKWWPRECRESNPVVERIKRNILLFWQWKQTVCSLNDDSEINWTCVLPYYNDIRTWGLWLRNETGRAPVALRSLLHRRGLHVSKAYCLRVTANCSDNVLQGRPGHTRFLPMK